MQAIYKVIKADDLQAGHILDQYSREHGNTLYEVTAVDLKARTFVKRALVGRRAGQEFTCKLMPAFCEYAVYDRKQLLRLKGVTFVTKDPFIMEVG